MLTDYESYFLNPRMKKYYDKEQLYTLQLELTQKCQQGCIYCYSTEQSGSELDIDYVKTILDQSNQLNVHKIEWLGGDPLLHTAWQELLSYAQQECELINNVWTSGNLLRDRDIAEQIIELTQGGFVSFHLDSLNRKIYGELHETKPNFIEKTLEGIELLLDLGKPSTEILNCLALTGLQAVDDYEDTVKFFHDEYGIMTTFVSYKPTVNDSKQRVTSDQVRAATEIRNRVCLNNEPAIPQCVSKFYCGTTAAVITGGYLTPCSRIRNTSFGKLNDPNNFIDLFNEIKPILLTQNLRNSQNLSTTCQKCDLNTICWGCRSNAWYYGEGVFDNDLNCWHQNKSLE